MLASHEKLRMNIEVITSFNQHYYDLIGKDCVDTWMQYWPQDMTLTCYVEEFSIPTTPRIKQISFDSFDSTYQEFQDSGENKQAKKFAKKAFSFIHAMENSTADRIIWLDADVLSTSIIDKSILINQLPDDCLSTHMGVTYYTTKDGVPGRWFVPETGFFAINAKHKDFAEFRSEYKRHYVEHDHKDLRRFYDNDVYGYVFEKLKAKGNDLCVGLAKPYKTPLKHTILGPYLNHYKAKHSKESFSLED
jgi:hypothetical protein